MKVIMLADVDTVGQIGDVVNVAAGYARNFLLPRKLAAEATERSVKNLNHQKRVAEARRKKEVAGAEAVKRRIETTQIHITANVGEEDKLFGSIGTRDIEEALAAQGVEIDRKRIVLDEPIKRAGVHEVPIRLGYDVIATARVQVVKAETPEA
ncbi:50S ribosomal protein L9 [bacterium]|nr:50S ribosomal protein L9 [bacterium]